MHGSQVKRARSGAAPEHVENESRRGFLKLVSNLAKGAVAAPLAGLACDNTFIDLDPCEELTPTRRCSFERSDVSVCTVWEGGRPIEKDGYYFQVKKVEKVGEEIQVTIDVLDSELSCDPIAKVTLNAAGPGPIGSGEYGIVDLPFGRYAIGVNGAVPAEPSGTPGWASVIVQKTNVCGSGGYTANDEIDLGENFPFGTIGVTLREVASEVEDGNTRYAAVFAITDSTGATTMFRLRLREGQYLDFMDPLGSGAVYRLSVNEIVIGDTFSEKWARITLSRCE